MAVCLPARRKILHGQVKNQSSVVLLIWWGNLIFSFLFKHRVSLYLKFEGLNLSVVIIFNTFHWLKNFESCSVVSIALLCVTLLLRQRKVILCCCETTFLIIAELTYNLTYQIIISPIPSIPDFVYSHFTHKNYLNC